MMSKSQNGGLYQCLHDGHNYKIKRVTDSKYAVLTLVKIKHRIPETRLNPCLIYLSRLEQMHVELTDAHMDSYGGAGGSYEC